MGEALLDCDTLAAERNRKRTDEDPPYDPKESKADQRPPVTMPPLRFLGDDPEAKLHAERLQSTAKRMQYVKKKKRTGGSKWM